MNCIKFQLIRPIKREKDENFSVIQFVAVYMSAIGIIYVFVYTIKLIYCGYMLYSQLLNCFYCVRTKTLKLYNQKGLKYDVSKVIFINLYISQSSLQTNYKTVHIGLFLFSFYERKNGIKLDLSQEIGYNRLQCSDADGNDLWAFINNLQYNVVYLIYRRIHNIPSQNDINSDINRTNKINLC